MARAVDRVLSEVGQPTVWSMIMTVFGDAIAPREGVLWTGSLIAIMELFGFNSGVVRTALSRLVADGWLEGIRVGRKSYYKLTVSAHAATVAAARRIYRSGPPPWDGTWDIVLVLGDASSKAGLRRTLALQGFGTVNGETFVRPRTAEAASIDLPDTVMICGQASSSSMNVRLAARAWDLRTLASSYQTLGQHLYPVFEAVSAGAIHGESALAARLIMVHTLRRLVLRDPDLPGELLPLEWPGTEVRSKVAAAYQRLLLPSEAHLSRIAYGPDGPLRKADRSLGARFGGE